MWLLNGIRAAVHPLEHRSILSANQYLVAWSRRVTQRRFSLFYSYDRTFSLQFAAVFLPLWRYLSFPPSHSQSFTLSLGPLRAPRLSLARWKAPIIVGCMAVWVGTPQFPPAQEAQHKKHDSWAPPRPPPASSASALVSSSSLSLHLITSNMIETKFLFPHAAWQSVPISLPNDPWHSFNTAGL